MSQLPEPFLRFQAQYATVADAWQRLGEACATAGPLDGKTRELVRLGIAVGARLEGAVHSHVRRAVEAGARPEEIRHVIVLAAATAGFPTTVAAFTWVEDILGGGAQAKR